MPAPDANTPHSQCVLCGTQNPKSMKLTFHAQADDSVRASFQAHDSFQGYDGILHGGIIAALLDSAMTHCLFHRGISGVTGELRVRYRQAIPCGTTLDIWARLMRARPPLYQLESEIRVEGQIMAWAEAKFMMRTKSDRPEG